MKKLSTFSAFLFISIIALLFVQCSESTIDPNDQAALSLNKYEPAANNLSFPGLLADNYTITPIAGPLFTTAFTGPYTDLSAEELAIAMGDTWYAQKVDGNIWQAEFAYVEATEYVDVVDWGDNMESFSPTVGTPFRIEFGLYKDLDVPMMTYPMALLANPSTPDEIQGTNNKPTETYLATIATDKARLVVQPYSVDASTLVWNGSSWTGAEASESVVFGVELNVAGKLIYGAAQKGWKPAKEGKYRITFYLDNSEVNISSAVLGSAPTDQVAFPVIDAAKNITYVDIVVLPRSGGKK